MHGVSRITHARLDERQLDLLFHEAPDFSQKHAMLYSNLHSMLSAEATRAR